MSDSAPAPAPAGAGSPPMDPTAVPPGLDAAATAQWEAMVAQMSKQGGVTGFPGAMPFSMAPFAQPFMYGGFMLPGLMPGFGLPGAEGEAKEEGEGSGEDDTEDEGDDSQDDDGDSSGKEGGRPKRKRAARGATKKKAVTGDGVVKSNSNAALAMLAGAAATKPGAPGNPAAAAAAAAMQQNLGELWGTLNGGAGATGAMPATTSGLDISKLTSEQQQQLLAAGGFEGIGDEREIKRMRRKQSNRESARRSRLRKQAECEQLARQVKDMGAENARLKEEKMQLMAQIEILNAKLSMSAFGAVHALGGVSLPPDGLKAELNKQTQDMQTMAAAMAQAMQVNGGAMLGTGLGIPALDPKALDGEEAVMAAAAAGTMEGTHERHEQEPPSQ